MRDGGETTVLDLFGVELERAFGELEPLLNERRELTNTPPLLSQHFLRVRRADNNLFTSTRPIECQSAGRSSKVEQVDVGNDNAPRYERVSPGLHNLNSPPLRVRE